MVIRAAGFALLLALGACAAQSETEVAALSPISTAPVAPSSGICQPANVTLYFAEQVASDEPVVTPLLNDFMARIRDCETAGAPLRAITIETVADPGQSARAAQEQVARRVERVRAALVNIGAPSDKISAAVAPRAAPIMGRRAEVTATFE